MSAKFMLAPFIFVWKRKKSKTRSPAANHRTDIMSLMSFSVVFSSSSFLRYSVLCVFFHLVFLLYFAFPGVRGCVIGCMFVYYVGYLLFILRIFFARSLVWDSNFLPASMGFSVESTLSEWPGCWSVNNSIICCQFHSNHIPLHWFQFDSIQLFYSAIYNAANYYVFKFNVQCTHLHPAIIDRNISLFIALPKAVMLVMKSKWSITIKVEKFEVKHKTHTSWLFFVLYISSLFSLHYFSFNSLSQWFTSSFFPYSFVCVELFILHTKSFRICAYTIYMQSLDAPTNPSKILFDKKDS